MFKNSLFSKKRTKKKLLILVDSVADRKNLYTEAIAVRLADNVQIFLLELDKLKFILNPGRVDVYIDNNDIRDFDHVYFRRTGAKFSSIASTLASVLKKEKISFNDTIYTSIGPKGIKLTALTLLANEKLPIIPSYFAYRQYLKESEEEIVTLFGYPFVAKEFATQRGKGVYLIRNSKEFKALFKKDKEGQFIIQKYIQANHEYRLLVLGNKVGSWEEKLKQGKDSFEKNVALWVRGVASKHLPVSEINSNLSKIAIKAAQVLGIQVAGVDILVDEDGNYRVVEVNRGPEVTYDQNVSSELKEIGNYFASILKVK